MPRYHNKPVDSGDGSDFKYRATIVDRYKVSAAAKKSLQKTIPAFLVYAIFGLITLAIPASSLEMKQQAGAVSLTSLVPLLLVYLALNPKILSSLLCYTCMLWCALGCLVLLIASGISLKENQDIGTFFFALVAIVGAALNGYTVSLVHMLQQSSAHTKKK
mmetsp:Transcript_28537/g.39736  ORF Transcript_28537/g.39736 Transcript_28537/m.39736 type:complete len:161 (-) Transcript_28537:71-553(-)|eukprot:CAMPEP_0184478382 /NCGR_PEP_ID=MMETSP0113_2-20130426/431_1 /TAXON_ID=91329 /ORGANISM="Norrisiella sphaerica, Strain BC52" /LENGTH=160 /DNA_ID=CAMNT_0026856153 /DNA_START=185 /DNA_END=667 /DNA_ORIENTATION=+